MKPLFSYSIKAGLLAFGLAAGLSAPSVAGPMPQPVPSVPNALAAPDIIPVRDSWAGGNDRHFRSDWRWRHNRHWRGNDHWRGNRHGWDRRWHHRRHWRGGSGIYFGLGGFGLGSAYDYYQPRYYRTYRTHRIYRGGSSAHVRWCHNRYRSYRAWDNTYQPYNGPRRQCHSPYR